jgi:hypothetical protein
MIKQKHKNLPHLFLIRAAVGCTVSPSLLTATVWLGSATTAPFLSRMPPAAWPSTSSRRPTSRCSAASGCLPRQSWPLGTTARRLSSAWTQLGRLRSSAGKIQLRGIWDQSTYNLLVYLNTCPTFSCECRSRLVDTGFRIIS